MKSNSNCFFLAVCLDQSRSALVTNMITCILNCFLSITTVCGNAFVIFVIWERAILHVPSNTLLCCLAISDLVVGLISQPSFVIYKIAEILGNFDVYCAARMLQSCSGWLTAGVSLLTLCAISLDRYLAVRTHLRYTTVVTVNRILSVVIGFWLICATAIAVRFVMKESQWNAVTIAGPMLIVFVTVSAYIQVFRVVRRHRRQIYKQIELAQRFHGRNAQDVIRHRKSAVTMLCILGTFLLCYIPFISTIVTEAAVGYTLSVKIAYDYTTTVAFLSSSLNPVIYCCRIRNIRRAFAKTMTRRYINYNIPCISPALKRG